MPWCCYILDPKNMRRTILPFALGIFCTFLFTSFLAVFLFHDIDPGATKRAAFLGLCVEGLFFGLFIVVPTLILTWLGLHLFGRRANSSQPNLALLLGVGLTVVQYPFEFAGRILVPRFNDAALSLYLVVAVVVCTAVFLWNSQKH